ncbi:MAG: hypothetical protein H7Y09_00165 [Chitinophagaceae bacterium]|nr:hypothetical protein [Anaerolineae bacterium]
MFNTAIIEVAIGLIFVFCLMAILVTQINSFIVNILNLRAKQLKESLQDLITDPDIQAKVLAHPLINMVKTTVPPTVDLSATAAARITNTEETKLTYIEPRTFVAALSDVLVSQIDTLYNKLQNAADDIPNSDEKSKIRELLRVLRSGFSEQTIRDIRAAFSVVADPEARAKLLKGLEDVEEALDKLTFRNDQLVPLLEGVKKITDQSFQKAMETILTTARTLEEAEARLESWFNDGMNRATDIYKRRIQYITLVVSLTLAIILNVDTLHLARALWEDPILRTDLVAQANVLVANPPPEVTPEATPEPGTSTEGSIDAVVTSAQAIDETVQQLIELQLPIGWESIAITSEMVETSRSLGLADPLQNPRNLWNFYHTQAKNTTQSDEDYEIPLLTLWLQKIVGILVTTIAAAQGAPFWFDLLNRIARPK